METDSRMNYDVTVSRVIIVEIEVNVFQSNFCGAMSLL